MSGKTGGQGPPHLRVVPHLAEMDLTPPGPDWKAPRDARGRVCLPPDIWVKIQYRYERGDNLGDISKAYEVGRAAISNRAKREGWRAHGSVLKEATVAAREEVAEHFKTTYKDKAIAATGRHVKIWESLQRIGGAFIEDLAEITRRRRMAGKREFGKELLQMKTLAETMRIAVEGERLTLNMDAIPLEREADGFSKLCDKLDDAVALYEKEQQRSPLVDVSEADGESEIAK